MQQKRCGSTKKFSAWVILIVFLLTASSVSREVLYSGKHVYKVIYQNDGKITVENKIRMTVAKKLHPVRPTIIVRIEHHPVYNHKVRKIFLLDNRKKRTEILLRKQRARSSIDKIEHMFYYVTRPTYSVKGLEYGRLQGKNCGNREKY